MTFDAARAFQDVQTLSFPRRAGGQNEARAIGYIRSQLEEIGLTTEVEEFSFSPLPFHLGWRLVPLFIGSLVLAAVVFLPTNRAVAALLCLIALGCLSAATRWNSVLERAFDLNPQKRSFNLMARKNIRGADRDLVILAHYDSKSQTMPLALRVAFYFLAGLLVLLMALITVISAAVGHWVVPQEVVVALSVGLFAVMVSLQFNFTGDESPGGLDNAAGVGVLLELARCLGKLPGGRTRLTFLATGAEEEGMAGALRFIQKHQGEFSKERTFFLNYDMPGVGNKVALVARHGLPPLRTAGRLVGLVTEAAREARLPLVRKYLPLGAGMDHMPIAFHGFQAVSIAGAWLHPAVFRTHSRRDTPDGLSLRALQNAGELGLKVVEKLESVM